MNSILPPVENPDAPHLQNQSIGDWFKKESELLKRHYGLEKTKQLELTLDKPVMWTHYCVQEKTEIDIGKGEDCNWCGQQEAAQELINTPPPVYTDWNKLGEWEAKNMSRCFIIVSKEDIQERLEEEVTTKELKLIEKNVNIFLAIDDIWRQYDTTDTYNHLVETIVDHIKKKLKEVKSSVKEIEAYKYV